MLTDLDGTARLEAKGTCMRFYPQVFNSGLVVKRSIVRDPAADPRLRVKTALTPHLNLIHGSSIVFFFSSSYLCPVFFSVYSLPWLRSCPSHFQWWTSISQPGQPLYIHCIILAACQRKSPELYTAYYTFGREPRTLYDLLYLRRRVTNSIRAITVR